MAGPERSCLLCRSTKEMEGNRCSRGRERNGAGEDCGGPEEGGSLSVWQESQ